MKKLENKNIIVTGCNRGIGKAILDKCVENGANIWACTRTFTKELEIEYKELEKKYGVWIKHVPIDFCDEESIKEAIKNIISDKMRIDVIVNNAGMPHSGMLAMTPMKDLRQVMEVNFIAPLMLIQGLSRKMIKQKEGNIINIASIGGIEVREGFLAYGSSKAALIWATKAISKELGPHNIRVNGIAPGFVDTRMGVNIHTEDYLQEMLQLTTMKRLGVPEEIANTVLFLASEESSFMTGQIISVDGGR